MAIKCWNIPKEKKEISTVLAEECGIPPFVADILVSRGLTTVSQVLSLLGEEDELEDPFALKDMDKAVKRIFDAIESGESVVIYGDYDCDGVTSTTILYLYLSLLGANVSYYIPKRVDEGYGLNKTALTTLAEQGCRLVITVDNGISAIEEVEHANGLGMTVIVTDHHQVGDVLPNAYAVINPHRKDSQAQFRVLAGVGVAFKVIAAMEGGDYHSALEQFGDLVAIGTIGDIVPLIGENRTIVKYGLKMISHTDNVGLNALMQVANISTEAITSQTVAFGIAPRINAAGRMKDAALAVELFLSDDETEALALAEQLNELNTSRKEQEEVIQKEIEEQISQNPDLLNDRVLMFYKEGWHHGIIGIVSSKLLEQYGKPNLLMALDDESLVGSARSVSGFSLYKALCDCSEKLTRFGGHTQAAGFSLLKEDYEVFYAQMQAFAAKQHRVMPAFEYKADKEILPLELTMENIKSVSMLEPFGEQNQQPLYFIRNTTIEGITPVSENKHLRLKLRFGDVTMTAMCFRTSTESFAYKIGNVVDFLGNITINLYQNREYLSVVVKDIRPSGFVQDNYFNAKTYYETFRRQEPLSKTVVSKMIPTRDELAVVYKHLKQTGGFHGDVDMLYPTFLTSEINYCKYRLILDILAEAKLIQLSPLLNDITLCSFDGKADLESVDTMKKLRNITS